jgi:hypothetical protein
MRAVTEATRSGGRKPRTLRRFASAREADREDLAYWLQIPESERILEVWRLSQELWRLSGQPAYEPGLSRSVTRLHRR